MVSLLMVNTVHDTHGSGNIDKIKFRTIVKFYKNKMYPSLSSCLSIDLSSVSLVFFPVWVRNFGSGEIRFEGREILYGTKED